MMSIRERRHLERRDIGVGGRNDILLSGSWRLNSDMSSLSIISDFISVFSGLCCEDLSELSSGGMLPILTLQC